jgi:hypothetical protein
MGKIALVAVADRYSVCAILPILPERDCAQVPGEWYGEFADRDLACEGDIGARVDGCVIIDFAREKLGWWGVAARLPKEPGI